MAGGKLTPRQKMINLMYLIFIAMLALNMSKEVLSAFGLFNEKFEMANANAVENNESIMNALALKAADNPAQFGEPKKIGEQVVKLSNEFYSYVDELKKSVTAGIEVDPKTGKLPYESMDKADAIDYTWFKGDGLTEKGKEVMSTIQAYRENLTKLIGGNKKYQPIVDELNARFSTEDVVDKEGIKKPFLDYHYRGFPAIASLTKLTAMQSDAKYIESQILNALIGNTAIAAASMKNYAAIVIPEKSAFFAGETFKGKVVLGRYDKSTVPTKVVVNGSEVNLANALEDGQVNLSFNTGNVGEHDINGKFVFMEDGKPVEIDIKGNYVVVPKPNSATVSADKMNVVYRGVDNPMSISFAGLSDDKVTASAPGLSKGSKAGQYIMRPGQGNEVVINVTGKLPNGDPVSDKKMYRIKSIPAPTGHVRGESGIVKGPASSLEKSTVSAKILDFDFDLNVNVTGFNVKVPGQPTVVVQGNRMSPQAIAVIKKAGRGDQITISEIKTKLVGAKIDLFKTHPVIYEVQ